MSERKYIEVAEFRAAGYLQEVNRRVLHPAGLALSVEVHDDGTETVAGIWDYRADPEGMLYGPDEIDQEKIRRVDAEIARHIRFRRGLIGTVVQADGLTSEQMAQVIPGWEEEAPAPPEYDRATLALIERLATLLNELYDQTGILIYLAAPHRHLGGRSASEAIRDRDQAALQLLCDGLDAMADGVFL